MRVQKLRAAATLVELLIVISLIVVLATLSAMVLPALRSSDNSVKAATQITAALNISKQQALRDQAPRGLRFIRDPDNPNWARGFQYIEMPLPVIPTPAFDANNIALPMTVRIFVDNGGNYLAQLRNAQFRNDWVQYGIEVDDYLVVTTQDGTQKRNYVASILGFQTTDTTTPSPRDTLRLHVFSTGFPGPINPPLSVQPLIINDGFKIIRRPRILAGEDAIQLPKHMIVDLNPLAAQTTYPYPSPIPWSGLSMKTPILPNPEPDVIFLPSGEISGAPYGKIILVVRNDEEDYPTHTGKMTLVVIYTRTGQIIMHTVPATGDPYEFTKDGQGSGL
jgi:type II secretory pathway pseudopilin PulG